MKFLVDYIFTRNKSNPILTAEMWPYPVNSVFNPGAIKLSDGNTLLLCRVEDRTGISHFCAARSLNGIDNWKIDDKPTILPDPENFPEEMWGIEDPRIIYLPELEQYIIVYTSYSCNGPGISLILTNNFKEFKRLGLIMSPNDKDGAILPRKFNGVWKLIHRPINSSKAHIWISDSPDLIHWNKNRILLKSRFGNWWDANRIGLSTPLIETEFGWLMIYHGVKNNASGCIYRLGLALFDLENPEICLKRCNEWFFNPKESYEIEGDVNKVVFPCGYTIEDDKDKINIYYGAADSCIAMASGSIQEILYWLQKQ